LHTYLFLYYNINISKRGYLFSPRLATDVAIMAERYLKTLDASSGVSGLMAASFLKSLPKQTDGLRRLLRIVVHGKTAHGRQTALIKIAPPWLKKMMMTPRSACGQKKPSSARTMKNKDENGIGEKK